MRSFAALAVFFTSVLAAPLSGRSAGLPVDLDVRGTPSVPAPPSLSPPGLGSLPIPKLDTRSPQCSISCVLNELVIEIQPLVEELEALVPATATVEIVTELAGEITTAILNAVPKLTALVGAELDLILKDVNGVVLTVDALAKIVFHVVDLVLSAVAHIVAILAVGPTSAVFVVLVSVVKAVLAILQVIVQLVPAIVACLGPLVAPYVQLIECLGVTELLTLLHLSA